MEGWTGKRVDRWTDGRTGQRRGGRYKNVKCRTGESDEQSNIVVAYYGIGAIGWGTFTCHLLTRLWLILVDVTYSCYFAPRCIGQLFHGGRSTTLRGVNVFPNYRQTLAFDISQFGFGTKHQCHEIHNWYFASLYFAGVWVKSAAEIKSNLSSPFISHEHDSKAPRNPNHVENAIYNIQYTIHYIKCTMYNTQCTIYNTQYTPRKGTQYSIGNTQNRIYNTTHNTPCTTYNT